MSLQGPKNHERKKRKEGLKKGREGKEVGKAEIKQGKQEQGCV